MKKIIDAGKIKRARPSRGEDFPGNWTKKVFRETVFLEIIPTVVFIVVPILQDPGRMSLILGAEIQEFALLKKSEKEKEKYGS